ncbi:MAG: 50S ribosomal protein L9 [Verrucomicrobiota bacterium]|nr:50S ribosomal protein L9 [Verrucomicrobiota bacterium]
MAKTEVILTHNIIGLGAESDQVKVAAGYARNYLIPRGLAIPLTAANKKRFEALQKRRAEREAQELNTMAELAQSVSKLLLKITVKTGADGKMFGAVTAGTIADELKHQYDVTLDKKKIHLESPIHTLGEHEVELRLHPDVTSKLKVLVESSTPLELPAAAQPGPAKGAQQPEAAAKPAKPAREKKEKTTGAAKGQPAKEPKQRTAKEPKAKAPKEPKPAGKKPSQRARPHLQTQDKSDPA